MIDVYLIVCVIYSCYIIKEVFVYKWLEMKINYMNIWYIYGNDILLDI